MMEEISTISHLAINEPLLFDELPCVECGMYEETFEHLFYCENHEKKFEKIMSDAKRLIILLIIEMLDNDTLSSEEHRVFSEIRSADFWTLAVSTIDRIDIFKGIVPKILVDQVNKILRNERKTYYVISQTFNMIEESFRKDIWVLSRDRLHLFIRDVFGLTAIERKKISHKDYKGNKKISFTSTLPGIEYIDHKEIMRNLIYFGIDDFA